MDGYLGQIEDRLNKMQAQINLHAAVLVDPLAAKAKADDEARQAAADEAKANAEKAAADYEARRKEEEDARERALEDARKEADDELAKERELHLKERTKAQIRAERAAEDRTQATLAAQRAATLKSKEAARSEYEKRFGADWPVTDAEVDETLANQDYKPADDHARPANAERFIDDAGKAKNWQAPSEFEPTPPNERIDPVIGSAPDPRVGGVPGPKRGNPPDPRTGFAPIDQPMNTADELPQPPSTPLKNFDRTSAR